MVGRQNWTLTRKFMGLAYIVYFSLLLMFMLFSIPALTSKIYGSEAYIINRVFIYIPVIIVSIVLGCRYGVGIDYFNYENSYNSQCYHSIFDTSSEYLFGSIYHLCYKLGFSFAFVQVILNLIFWFFFVKAFSSDKILFRLVILFFFITGTLFLYLNIQRQCIALIFLFYSIRYIEKKDFAKFAFFVLIASGFHLSSLLFVPFYYLWHIIYWCKYRWVQLALWLGSYLFSAPLENLISELSIRLLVATPYEKYGGSVFTWELPTGSGMGIVVKGILDIVIILYSKKLFEYVDNKPRFQIAYLFFFIGVVLSNIFQYNLLLNRVAFLFVSFRIVILAYLFKCVFFSSFGSVIDKIICLILLLICIVYFIGMIYVGNNGCSPFHFVIW